MAAMDMKSSIVRLATCRGDRKWILSAGIFISDSGLLALTAVRFEEIRCAFLVLERDAQHFCIVFVGHGMPDTEELIARSVSVTFALS